MKDFFYAFKVSGLFIGTVIGAGFATGEEIRLYFNNLSDSTVILSSMIFGLFSLLFLLASKKRKPNIPKPFLRLWKAVKFIAVSISLVAMCSAAEEIIYAFLRVRFGGVIVFVICLFLGEKENSVLAGINALIVPVIVIFITAVYIKGGGKEITLCKINIAPAVVYSAMNIFGGGLMLDKIGKDMSVKQIIYASIISFFIMCAMMLCIKKTVENNTLSMPLLRVAIDNGMAYIGGIIVIFAIFTTMLSDVNIISCDLKDMVIKKWIRSSLLCALCGIGICVNFSNVVSSLYPYIGYCGVVYVIHATVRLFSREFSFDKNHYRVHKSGKGA